MPDPKRLIDEIHRILDPYQRELMPAAGDVGFTRGHVKGVDRENRQVTAVLSTPRIDRYGEVVLPSAFKASLDEFRANPKFLAGHIYGTRDGEPTSIGEWADVQVSDKALTGIAQFLPPGDELADKWWRRFDAGVVRTFSVGFIAREWEMREVTIGGDVRRIRHFTQADLLEVSAVEIPANPDAMLRSLGLSAQRDPGEQPTRGGDGLDLDALSEKLLEKLAPKLLQAIHQDMTDPETVDAMAREIARSPVLRGSHGHDEDLDGDAAPRGGANIDNFARELSSIIEG